MNYLERPLGINDLETTGLNSRHCEILEIGLVLIERESLEVITTFESKVKPTFQRIIEPEDEKAFDFRILKKGEKVAFRKALEINGYNEEEWRHAPPLKEAIEGYVDATDGAVFGAQNNAFDWGFVDVACEEAGVRHRMPYQRLDLFTRNSILLVQYGVRLPKYSQDDVAMYFNLDPEPMPHRAMQGARLAHEVYKRVSFLS